MSDTPVKPKNPDLTKTFHTREDSAEPTKGPAGPQQASEPLPEKIGDYRIIAKLGEGGMGAVYRAEDVKLKREVALKVMRPEIAAHPASKERFLREARAVAALKHDHIVTIHQVGEEDGIPFLAMELLEGMSLQDHLHSGKPLSWLDIARIGRDIARGLALAHSKGMIHRDIKPGNIWLETLDQSADGVMNLDIRVKILDFGLARPISDSVHLTNSGAIIGTPSYMAPEQASGDPLDGRCDLFSLGALLYKLCSGRVPFQGKDVLAVLHALAVKTPEPLSSIKPEVPVQLQQLIDRLVAKNRDDRPASAQLVVTELKAIINEQGSGSNMTIPIATAVAGSADPWAGIDDETQGDEQASRPIAAPGADAFVKPPASRGRKGLWIGMAFFSLLLAAGIIIIVKSRDGKETQVEVPDGSKVTVTDKGKVLIELPKDPDPKVAKGLQQPDRKAAVALNRYADFVLRLAAGKEVTVKKSERLPEEEFAIIGITFFEAPPNFAEEIFLPAVMELRNLEAIISYLNLTESQFVQLADLPLARTLKELIATFELTPKTLDGLKRFPKLGILRCYATKVGDAQLTRLSELASLQILTLHYLGRSGEVTAKGREAIVKLPLVGLALDSSPVVDREFLRLLPKMSKLTGVNFFGCPLGDDSLPILALAPNLHSVGLGATGITDAGLGHLAKFPKLRGLIIITNPGITDAGLDVLAKMPGVVDVDLHGTKVTAAGVKKLSAARLDMTIAWDGGTILPYAADRKAAVALNPHVDLTLKLASGKEVTIKKVEALPTEGFTVSGISFLDAALPPKFAEETFLPAVAELGSLESIIGNLTMPLAEDQFVQLAGLPLAKSLKNLWAGFELTPKTFDGLKRFPKLGGLRCYATKVGDAQLTRLSELASLQTLTLHYLGRSGKVSAQGREAIVKLPLVLLGLDSSPVVDRDFLRLLPKMSKLTNVNFYGCALGDDSLPILALAPNLQSVGLGATGITDAGLGYLAKFPKPWGLTIIWNPGITDAGLDVLAKMPGLVDVDLRGTKVTAAGVKKLASARPDLAIGWDGGTILPYAADRKAALALNPYVDLTLKLASGSEATVKKGEALPAEGFTLTRIALLAGAGALPQEFAAKIFLHALVDLHGLEAIDGHLYVLELTEEQATRLARMPLKDTLSVLSAGFELTPKILDELKRFAKLNYLQCLARNVDDPLLGRLSELNGLTILSLSELGSSGKVSARGRESILELPVVHLGLLTSPVVDQAFIQLLPRMTKLSNVDFYNCPIGNDALPMLARVPNLKAVFLGKTAITDAGLEQFSNFPKLSYVDVGENHGITDAGLEKIAKTQSVKRVQLRLTKVTATGVKKLAAARPDLTIVWDGGTIEPTQQ